MSWEYRALRRSLRLRKDALLARFERFCEEAATDISRMEWSCKLAGGVVDQHRFVACADITSPDRGTARAFPRLLQLAGFADEPGGGSGAAFRRAVTTYAQGVVVAYAGGGAGRSATLKAYVGWKGGSAELDEALVGDRRMTLPGEPYRMIGRSVDASGRFHGRGYAFYDQGAERDAHVMAWLTSRFGAVGTRLLALHPRFGLARKPDGPSTLLVALRPSGHDRPHPSHTLSPLLATVSTLAEQVPALRERFGRVTWIGASPDVLERPVGELPDQLGVYVRLVS